MKHYTRRSFGCPLCRRGYFTNQNYVRLRVTAKESGGRVIYSGACEHCGGGKRRLAATKVPETVREQLQEQLRLSPRQAFLFEAAPVEDEGGDPA